MPSIIPKITINGKESTEISGLMIVSLPPITKPAMRAVAEEIDGRDGDQIEKLGFSAYDKTIRIALSGDYDVDDVIEYFNQDGIITFSNEPDKYYHFKQLEGIDFEKLMRYKTADVVFHCQPFKFSTTEEEKIFSNPESVNITNSGNYFSKPEIVLTGKGNMEMSINDAPVLAIDFGDEEQTIAIDAQSMNAYGTKNNIKEAIFEINPSQDLHGYDSAWLDSETPFKKPYNLINVAGTASRIGNAMIDKLIGGSFAFNQLIYDGNFSENPTKWVASSASTNLSVSNGIASYEATANYAQIAIPNKKINVIANHKYLCGITAKANDERMIAIGSTYIGYGYKPIDTEFKRVYSIREASSTIFEYPIIVAYHSVAGDIISVKDAVIVDLTQMLGSTIADYIYSLEQATAGAGVAYFRALFPDDYYPYNVGELLSVKTSAHIMRNSSNAILANYPLDANLELRGIPQIDANGNLSYDGDEYTADGNVLRKYGIVDLGSLNWNSLEQSTLGLYFYADIPSDMIKRVGAYGNTIYPMLCTKYRTSGRASNVFKDQCICADGTPVAVTQIQIKDSAYTDTTAFKASLSGIYLIYQKATATTETADAFVSPQIVDASGSMEYVDARAVKIPVGHVSMYANNCEILGFTESIVSQTGTGISKTIPVAWAVNQWDEEWEIGTYDTTTGEKKPAVDRIRNKNLIPVNPNTTYFIYCGNYAINLYGILRLAYDRDGNFLGGMGSNYTDTFITPNDCYYVAFSPNVQYGTEYNGDISINSPASDHNYHAYSGIPTAYRAQLIFLDGTWELRLLSKKINMGSLSWEKIDDDQGSLFRSNEIDVKKIQSSTEIPNVLCGLYPTVSNAQRANHSLSMENNMAKIDVIDDGFDDVASFKTAMKNIDLEYEMQSPVSVSLSADELTSLLGINNIWHDANGETEIIFTKDGDVEHETSGMIATFYIDVDDLVFGVFKNRLIIGDYDKIQLKKGLNTISFAPIEEGSEISEMAIDFYSRWL